MMSEVVVDSHLAYGFQVLGRTLFYFLHLKKQHFVYFAVKDHNYALAYPASPPRVVVFDDVDDVSCNMTVETTLGGVSDNWEDSVMRCICGFTHDDGFMICCDRCS